MNRQQRRQFAKKNHIPFKSVAKFDEPVDRTNSQFCWRHRLALDNVDKPTERDKRLIESVRLKPFKSIRDGKQVIGRRCGRCLNEILLPDPLQTASKEPILKVPEGNEYADISMPDVPE